MVAELAATLARAAIWARSVRELTGPLKVILPFVVIILTFVAVVDS